MFVKKVRSMRIYLFILFFGLSFLSHAQFTTIVDNNFEQALINLGYDNLLDSSVLTSNIDTITALDVSYQNISNLSGIEGFATLEDLNCSNNSIDSLDLNQNTLLKKLYCSSNDMKVLLIDNLADLDLLDCSFNSLTALNLTQNIELDSLECSSNQLSALEVNTNLGYLYCGNNNLTSLDLSSLIFNGLHELRCENNAISSIDLANNANLKHLTCHNNLLQEIDLSSNYNLQWLSIGNNSLFANSNNLTHLDLSFNCDIENLYCSGNLNLYCIQVCDTLESGTWISDIDSQMYYSVNCNYTGLEDFSPSKEKLISIQDVYGRESFKKTNSLLFFLYQDGMVEKRIILHK